MHGRIPTQAKCSARTCDRDARGLKGVVAHAQLKRGVDCAKLLRLKLDNNGG